MGIFPVELSRNRMKTPPEAYLIFKAELKKAQLEKEKLRKAYEDKLIELNRELARLKEQIAAQQELIKTTIDYAVRIEEDMDHFKQEVEHNKAQRKNSFH
jgi:predicted  nucleic acid-binding Zn-ribbon protein